MHKHTLPRTRPARARTPLVIAALHAGGSIIPK